MVRICSTTLSAVTSMGVASAFVPAPQFSRSVASTGASSGSGTVSNHGNGCPCGSCSLSRHGAACKCASCSRSAHSMVDSQPRECYFFEGLVVDV
eukprot:CCRYP_009328-RA/>CCRYP_009328-RA protein AED:0.36 eAED:0.44 QI:257/0.5/0.66/1/0/0/3/0/94